MHTNTHAACACTQKTHKHKHLHTNDKRQNTNAYHTRTHNTHSIQHTHSHTQVGETERQRDAAIKEITALEEAGETEVAGAEELKKRLHAAESEGRRILEESQRWEVELRKLRVQYQV